MIKNKCDKCSNNNFCLSYNDLYKEVWEGRNFEISLNLLYITNFRE